MKALELHIFLGFSLPKKKKKTEQDVRFHRYFLAKNVRGKGNEDNGVEIKIENNALP